MTQPAKLLGLAGLAGSGKSTIALHLHNHTDEWIRTALTEPLKNMLLTLNGVTHNHVFGSDKEAVLPALNGHTARHAMQTLGTEWGRNCMGQDFWINLWKTRARKLLDSGLSVVVDDIRFQNEVTAILEMGGVVVYVSRGTTTTDPHPSEMELFKFWQSGGLPTWNNTGSLDDLIAGIPLELAAFFWLTKRIETPHDHP